MKDINSLEALIYDIDECIDSIFLIGINSIDMENLEEIRTLGNRCNEFGLKYAGKCLSDIVKEIENLKRNFDGDKTLCVRTISRLCEYMDLIKINI